MMVKSVDTTDFIGAGGWETAFGMRSKSANSLPHEA
jgi:hypothetical protein